MNQERIFQVLKGPRISEKAAMAADAGNQVVFSVAVDANKLEIKHAVEKLFDVKVDSVNVVNVKGKVKRNRHGLARRASLKKAYVRLAEGQEIDFSVAE
jgi:large subunit ribosomal protein L23